MTVSHHLDDATLLAYAAGTLSRPLAIVAKSHLEFCPSCRANLRTADALGGALLSSLDPAPLSSRSKDEVMSRIGSATLHRLPVSRLAQRDDLPVSLQAILKVDRLEDVPWRKSAPGVHTHRLPKEPGETGFFGLLKIAPGAKLPNHSHGGIELTLILKGAYHDELGHFGRGDIADLDESVEHTPVVVGGEPCICFVAIEAATRFRSWPARLMQKFVGF